MEIGDMKRYFKRFMRTVVPQIPTVLVLVAGMPDVAKYTILAGGLLTTLDKWAREYLDWYNL